MQVSYYSTSAMYRHQQAVAAAAQPQFHSGSPMHHSWYSGYHAQAGQPAAPTSSYCMQEEQQMWHHPAHHSHVYHQEFNDFVHNGGASLPQLQQVSETHDAQLPSPPITVSGSEMSSPGTGNISPANNQNRPTPARSPYEWIKKTSYQTQPNPGKTRTKDKYRVVYTDHQRLELEKEFNFNNKYITIRRKCELSTNLGLSERQIKIWFQNRRAKERKLLKKRFEEVKKENPDDKTQLQELQQRLHTHQSNQHGGINVQQSFLSSTVPML